MAVNCLIVYFLCAAQDPLQFMDAGTDAQNPYGILNFLIFLAVDAVLYFALVLLIEYGVFKKLSFMVSKLRIKMEFGGLDEDEDVRVEKERVTALSHSFKGESNKLMVLAAKLLLIGVLYLPEKKLWDRTL